MMCINITNFNTLNEINDYYNELKEEYNALAKILTEKKDNIVDKAKKKIEIELQELIKESTKYQNLYEKTNNESDFKKYLETLEKIKNQRIVSEEERDTELKNIFTSVEFTRLVEINENLKDLSKFIPKNDKNNYSPCKEFMSLRTKTNIEWLELITKLLNENRSNKYVVKIFPRTFNYKGEEVFSDVPNYNYFQEETIVVIAKEDFTTDCINTENIGYISSLSKHKRYEEEEDYIIYDRLSYPITDLDEYYNTKHTSITFPDMNLDILELIDEVLFQEYKEKLINKNTNMALKK